MKERNYYNKYKENNADNLLEYFDGLNLNDWYEFFDDYYKFQTAYLSCIFNCPKGEDVYSCGLTLLKGVCLYTKGLITKAHERLFSEYFYCENHDELLKEFFHAVRYLELKIRQSYFLIIIESGKESDEIRECASLAYINVYEDSNDSFWDKLDLSKDLFLIPDYIAFFRKKDPIKGLKKLILIQEKPDNTDYYESPIAASLKTISTSGKDIKDFVDIYNSKVFPIWARDYIDSLFEYFPELKKVKDKIDENKAEDQHVAVCTLDPEAKFIVLYNVTIFNDCISNTSINTPRPFKCYEPTAC